MLTFNGCIKRKTQDRYYLSHNPISAKRILRRCDYDV